MKIRSLILCGVFFLLVFNSIAAAQTEVTRLYTGNTQATMPYIVTMKNGDLMLVFSDGTSFNADARLFYMIYSQTGRSWSAPRVAINRRYSACIAQMAVDNDGDIHMVYVDGNSSQNREVYYSMFRNNRWTAGQLVYPASGYNSSWPRIQVEDDLIYVVWTYDYDRAIGLQDMVMVVNSKGAAWPVDRRERMTISNRERTYSVHGDFQVKDKKVHTVWLDESAPNVWALFYNEGVFNRNTNSWNFSRPVHLLPNHPPQYYPQLTLDPEGNVHIIYSHKAGPYFHIKKSGDKWSAPMALNRAGTTFNALPVIKYSHGLLHALWRETTGESQSIVYGRGLPDGSRWATPIIVGSGGAQPHYPEMTVDHNGDAHVVWSSGPDTDRQDLYYAKVIPPGAPPQAVIEASRKVGLAPLRVTFDASKSRDPDGSIIEYRWDFGDGARGAGRTVTHTFNDVGTYKVALSVVDNDFRIGTAQVEIHVSRGEPVAVIKASATRGVVPFLVSFDGSDSYDPDGEVVSYAWDFGDGATATGPVASHTYLKGGRYNARLTVTDDEGKTNTATVAIDVFQKPTARFTAVPNRGTIPLTVEFDASESEDEDGNIVSYQWTFGDGLTSQGMRVTHTYTQHGTFTVQLSVVDNDGFVDTAVSTIEAYGKPLAPTNVFVQTKVNRTLLFNDIVNRISWANNPGNTGLFTIAKYRVYRKPKGQGPQSFILMGEVAATERHFDDRKFSSTQDAHSFEYSVTAVDSEGRESDPSLPVSSL